MTDTIPPEALETLEKFLNSNNTIFETDEDYIETGEIFDEDE